MKQTRSKVPVFTVADHLKIQVQNEHPLVISESGALGAKTIQAAPGI